MKKNHVILGLVVLAAMATLLVWGWHRSGFKLSEFQSQLASADWWKIGIAVGCIYFAYLIRAARWALLLRHSKKVPLFSLLGTQVIGFTAVALIGRVADLVRPYLVAKKTSLPLSSQVAVYVVERLFDAGSMALIFSVAMIWVPTDEILRAAAHSGPLARLALHHRELALLLVRFGGLALTLAGALFVITVRMAGEAVASFFEHALAPVSKTLGNSIAQKILTFRSGLDTVRSLSDFAIAASISLAMWLIIACAYFEGCRAFVKSHELASITPSKCVLMMIASGGASIIQLPVLGWFSQIGLVVVALSLVLGASAEASTACAATLLLVTFLSIIPVGLIWAQLDHVSLRKVTRESENQAEELSEDKPTGETAP